MWQSFRNTLRGVPTEVWGALAVAILSALGASLIPLPQPWPLVVAVVALFLVFGVILWISNHVSIAWERKRRYNPSLTMLERTIRDVLFRRGFTVANAPQSGASFSISVQDRKERKMTVLQELDWPGYVLIGARVFLSEQEALKLTPLTTGDESLFHELSVEMAKFGLEFGDLEHPLREITLMNRITYEDAMMEARFLRQILFLIRGIVLVQRLVSRALRPIPG